MQKKNTRTTDKQLKSTSSLYYGLLILTVVLLFYNIWLLLTGKTYFKTIIHFVV
jgi:hypothetical protein